MPYQDTSPKLSIEQAALIREVYRSPGSFFELHGAILDKSRRMVRAPNLVMNKMQRQMDEIITWHEANQRKCKIIVLKPRQAGSTTMTVCSAYHQCRKKKTNACIIGDSYEESVASLINMFDNYAAEDTFKWGNTYDRPSGKFSHGSQILTRTANKPGAGRGLTLQTLICTEVAWWKETSVISAEQVFTSIMNAVADLPGNLVIVESTPNGVSGVYYDTFQKSVTFEDLKAGRIPEDWNGFVNIFYPWHEHYEYELSLSPEEEAQTMASLSEFEKEQYDLYNLRPGQVAWMRQKIASDACRGDEDKFRQEFPSDPNTCFLMSGTPAFPRGPLKRLFDQAELLGPSKMKMGVLQWTDSTETKAVFRQTGEDEAWIKVWEEPKAGHRYSVSVDPMTGQAIGKDPDNHGIGAWREGYWDPATGQWYPDTQVARLCDVAYEKQKGQAACRWDIQVMEPRVAMLASYYGWCLIAPELNMDRGLINDLRKRPRAVIYTMVRFNKVDQTETTKLGWETGPKTRGPIMERLKSRIRHWDLPGEGVMIWDPLVIKEFMTMVRDEHGKEVAMSGKHDDQVLQAAIALETLPGGKIYPHPRPVQYHNSGPIDMTRS